MSESKGLLAEDVPVIPPRFRLQWEPAQNAHVLLYPEGMVKLSESAAEILKRVNGANSVSLIIRDLENTFPGTELSGDVMEFLNIACERGWVVVAQRQAR
jgi:pyrroloquinoline quinone biosynthesis protein D